MFMKNCGRCGEMASVCASEGHSCPHCDANWDMERNSAQYGNDYSAVNYCAVNCSAAGSIFSWLTFMGPLALAYYLFGA